MKPMPLPPQEYLQQCFIYNPGLGILLWRPRPREHFSNDHWWHLWLSRYALKPAGSTHKKHPYRTIRIDRKSYYIHRVIWKLMTNEEPQEIDHKDGNKRNNRWTNLRAATREDNLANSPGWRNRGLPKGVRLKSGRYSARVRRYGKDIHLGSFATPEAAHAAYCAYAEANDGDFYFKNK